MESPSTLDQDYRFPGANIYVDKQEAFGGSVHLYTRILGQLFLLYDRNAVKIQMHIAFRGI